MRSPLLAFFRRAHDLHRQSRETGVAVDVLAASAANVGPRVSRRTFVAGAATVVAAACVPPAPATKKSVAVIGGGLAGLHCAHRLKRLGVVDVTVYEAQARLGGRCFSDRTTFAPLHCELGGELIDTGHQTMFDLADEFGLDLIDYKTDDAALEVLVAYFGGARVLVADVLTAYGPIAARIDSDLATLTGDGFVTYDANNNGAALDALSIKDWFDGLEVDGTIAADNIARRLFEVGFNIEFGRETDEQNVLNMLFLTSTSTDELALFGESDELFKIKDGNDAIVTGLADALAGNIKTGFTMTALSRASDGRFVVSFEGKADVIADEVVIALPFTILRDIAIDDSVALSAAKRLAIDSVGYGNNSKLMVGFDTRFWRDGTGENTSNGETFSDTGYQATWETSRLQDGVEGIITNFTGGDRADAAGVGTPEERVAEFLGEFEGVFAGVTARHNGKVSRFHWPTHSFVKASYSCYLPGQYTTIAGAEAEAEADGHLHFCGEHTSLDFQGYMEGAVVSGAAAALAVADNVGADADQALLAASPEQRILERAGRLRRNRRLRQRR